MTIKDLQLYKENDKYYLTAALNHEDKKGYYGITIPKIRLPISFHCSVNTTTEIDYGTPFHTVTVDLGFGELYVEPFDGEKNFYIQTCLEEKVHTMTLAEIEKELGYKIKLKEN